MALLVALAAVMMVMASLWLLIVGGPGAAHLTGEATFDAIAVLAYLPGVTAGLLLLLRLPRLAIGWITLLPATATALQSLAGRAIWYTHVHQGQPLLATEILAVLGDALWVPGVAVGFIALMVLFPDGRPVGTAWKWVLWVCGIAATGYAVVTLFVRAPLYYLETVDNPLGLFGDPGLSDIGQTIPLLILLLGGVPAGIVALILLWRRGTPLQREQVKWLLWAALILVFGIVASIIGAEIIADAPVEGGWTGAISDIASAALPTAVFIAVTRHRLYEIDRLVSRTLSYTVIAIVLFVVFTGGIIGIQTVLPEAGDLAVAGSTLAVAALFNPLRKRVQDRVDRRFNRSRYDAELVVEAFATRLRDEVDVAVITDDLSRVVATTIEPAFAGLWLRGDRRR